MLSSSKIDNIKEKNMHNLTYILQIAQIFLGLLLIILVLIHSPKGDGMAMLGGAAQLFSSQKGAERNLNKLATEDSKKETLCHEMVHGMLTHLGYTELSHDEQFVQALGNAIYQGFEIKVESEEV